jgi:hypothetical protein
MPAHRVRKTLCAQNGYEVGPPIRSQSTGRPGRPVTARHIRDGDHACEDRAEDQGNHVQHEAGAHDDTMQARSHSILKVWSRMASTAIHAR